MSSKLTAIALCTIALALSACGDAVPDPDAPLPQDAAEPGSPPAPATPGQPPAGDISPAPWDAARDRGAAWRGIGQEPGWTVEIETGGRIIYEGDYGATRISAADPGPQQQGSATVWQVTTEQGDLRVTFEELPCQDAMSGEEMPFTVTVTVNGQELRGCGRRL
jgi:uncharacterized membrane protein